MPRTEQALDQLVPATLRNVLFVQCVVKPWDLCRDLDIHIHTLKLHGPKMHAFVIFTAKNEELRKFRSIKEDKVNGRGFVEREKEREKRDGNKRKTKRTSFFIETVSGLRSLFYVEKSSEQMGQMLY